MVGGVDAGAEELDCRGACAELKESRCGGSTPAVVLEKILKPKGGGLREMVSLGEGDLCLRV